MSTVETRALTMHPKLLFDVISRQAGTLSKAILEGVMNAIDAKATGVDITVAEDHIEIIDDGQGFRSKDEITSWFEVFGQPHDESEDKIFANFRMGRGQLFSFGKNCWRSGDFQMDVDIKVEGLDYKLTEHGEALDGCDISVELYETLLPSEVARTVREVTKWVRWASIRVTLNGELVSQNSSEVEWEHETDDANISLTDGPAGLHVYNLGVFVTTMPSYRYGVSGEVVSKTQLKVNFARNDIQSDCPVWKRISKLVDKKGIEKAVSTKSMTPAARDMLGNKLRHDLEHMTAADAVVFVKRVLLDTRVMTATTGTHYQAKGIRGYAGGRIAVAPKGDRLGDKLHKEKVAFILATETLERFDFPRGDTDRFDGAESADERNFNSLISLIDLFKQAARTHLGYRYRDLFDLIPVNFEDMTSGMSRTHVEVSEEKLTAKEEIWLKVIEANQESIIVRGRNLKMRKIRIGSSDSAQGWTDGVSHITIAREYLKSRDFTLRHLFEVGALLLHEYVHDGPDTAEHNHGQEFYESFEASVECIGWFTENALLNMASLLRGESRKMSKQTQSSINRVASLTVAKTDYDAVETRMGPEEGAQEDYFDDE
jgi:hypothetical protein